MKNFFTIIAVVMVVLHNLTAQECNAGFFPFQEGSQFQTTHYDKKGKMVSASDTKILSVQPISEGYHIDIDVNSTDDKGKQVASGKSFVECKNGTYYFNLSDLYSSMMANNMLMEGMEVETDGKALDLPSNLQAGQTLPDGSSTISVKMNGVNLMSMNFNVTNRKVGARESVTTPAGTFDCFLITYDLELKTIGTRSLKVKSWWAKGVGLVRSENYNQKGDSEGKSELTKFVK